MDTKKKIRPGAIQLHPDESALVVQYEVQDVAVHQDGSQEVVSSSQATKKITVRSLSERSDIPALAADIVDKCKLIHPSKIGLVQGLLQQLQQRELSGQPSDATAAATAAAAAAAHAACSRPSTSSSNASGRAQHSTATDAAAGSSTQAAGRPGSRAAAAAATAVMEGAGRPASARPQSGSRPHTGRSTGSSSSRGGTPQQQHQQRQQQSHLQPPAQQQQQQYCLVPASEAFQAYTQALVQQSRPAFLDDLEVYIEGLYEEELPQRAAAAGMLCQLFRNTANLQALLSRDTLLPTLVRLAKEDGPRSLAMATAVSGCFFACSCITATNRQLLDNQVGSLLMDLLVLELQRSATREAHEGPGSSAAAVAARAAAAAAAAQGARQAAGPTAANGGQRQQQQQLLHFDQRDLQLLSLVVQQDRFLCLALATLINLAEEPSVQRKMVKRGVVGLLLGLLARPHLEVLLLAVGFLGRLCVFAEGKSCVASSQPPVVPQLVGLLQPGCGQVRQCGVLRLLHNLSFDGGLRQQMLAAGLVQQAVPLLDHPSTAPLAAGLLYQLSLDDAARAAFCFSPGGLHRLLDSILRALGPSHTGGPITVPTGLRTIPELIALAVNVAHCSSVAEWFHEAQRLEHLLQRALATLDELAWKLARNLAVSGAALLAPSILAHAGGMLRVLQSPDTGPELFVEMLGTLAAAADAACGCGSSASSSGGGNGCDADAAGAAAGAEADGSSSSVPPWQLMPGVSLQALLAFLAACLQQDVLEDDALLEAVVLLGALAGWEEGQQDLADSGLLQQQLVDVLPARRADDEFVLQACWAFRRALTQPATTQALLRHDQVVMYLVDLVQDPCVAVSRVASSCLDLIIDTHEDMAGAIRSLKFEAFNQEWLKLAGPEAHQLMAAAAAWQQQQVLACAQQQQQQQHLLLDPTDTPYSTLAEPVGGYQQQRQRRENVNGYSEQQEQQQEQEEPWQHGGMGMDGRAHEQEQEQQQLQWSSCPAGPVDGAHDPEQLGRPSMLTAGGQCMVLDFEAFASDAGIAAC